MVKHIERIGFKNYTWYHKELYQEAERANTGRTLILSATAVTMTDKYFSRK